MMYMFLCIQKGNNYYFSFILKVPEVIGCQQLSISLLGHRATKHCMRSLKSAWGRRMSKIMCLNKKEEGSLDCCWLRVLSIQEKNPEISVGAKVEFPIGKKLVHFNLKPRYVAVPDRGPGTGTNYEKGKWNTTFCSEIPTGKTGPPFWIFHFFWEFSSGTSLRNVFHLPPNQKFRKFWVNGKRP